MITSQYLVGNQGITIQRKWEIPRVTSIGRRYYAPLPTAIPASVTDFITPRRRSRPRPGGSGARRPGPRLPPGQRPRRRGLGAPAPPPGLPRPALRADARHAGRTSSGPCAGRSPVAIQGRVKTAEDIAGHRGRLDRHASLAMTTVWAERSIQRLVGIGAIPDRVGNWRMRPRWADAFSRRWRGTAWRDRLARRPARPSGAAR